jgi:hypothetical protein
MRRYASSRFRIALFVALMGAAIYAMAGSDRAQAQNTPPAGGNTASPAPTAGTGTGGEAAAPRSKPTLFGLIMGNRDFVFFTIIALSIAGVTFIIRGAIQNRASVLLPEASTNAIREMIQQKKFKELIDFTETDPSFVSRAINPAL